MQSQGDGAPRADANHALNSISRYLSASQSQQACVRDGTAGEGGGERAG